jgi:hypothetical protein
MHSTLWCLFLCSWTARSDMWPLIVFISLFPLLLALFHSSDCAWTPHSLLNTPCLPCTFFRTENLCTCLLIHLSYIISTYLFGLKQLECSLGKPNSWDKLLVQLAVYLLLELSSRLLVPMHMVSRLCHQLLTSPCTPCARARGLLSTVHNSVPKHRS